MKGMTVPSLWMVRPWMSVMREVAAAAISSTSAYFLPSSRRIFMPHIDALHVELVVGRLFAVEIDGVGVGGGRLGGHLQLVGRGLLPVGGEGGGRKDGQGRREIKERERNEGQGPASHRDLEQW